jgi:hypothetical protein
MKKILLSVLCFMSYVHQTQPMNPPSIHLATCLGYQNQRRSSTPQLTSSALEKHNESFNNSSVGHSTQTSPNNPSKTISPVQQQEKFQEVRSPSNKSVKSNKSSHLDIYALTEEQRDALLIPVQSNSTWINPLGTILQKAKNEQPKK